MCLLTLPEDILGRHLVPENRIKYYKKLLSFREYKPQCTLISKRGNYPTDIIFFPKKNVILNSFKSVSQTIQDKSIPNIYILQPLRVNTRYLVNYIKLKLNTFKVIRWQFGGTQNVEFKSLVYESWGMTQLPDNRGIYSLKLDSHQTTARFSVFNITWLLDSQLPPLIVMFQTLRGSPERDTDGKKTQINWNVAKIWLTTWSPVPSRAGLHALWWWCF